MIRDILEEHFDEAEDLFERRQLAFKMLDMTMEDLADMDARLRAHIDGFLLGGEACWEMARGYLIDGSKGQIYTAAIFAFESYDASRVQEVTKALEQPSPEALEGIGWACRITSWTSIVGFLKQLLNSEVSDVRALALGAMIYRRVNPGDAVEKALNSSSKAELIAGLNGAAILRDSKYKQVIVANLGHEDSEVSGAALEASVLHEPDRIAGRCRMVLSGGGNCPTSAASLLGVVGSEKDFSLLWKAATFEVYEAARAAVLAFGNLGYPAAVPALIQLLEHPRLIGIAGVSLKRIFGEIPLIEEDQLDDEESDDTTDWHPDDDLPRISSDSAKRWWSQNLSRFPANDRLRNGRHFQARESLESTPLPLRKFDEMESVLVRL